MSEASRLRLGKFISLPMVIVINHLAALVRFYDIVFDQTIHDGLSWAEMRYESGGHIA